MYKPTIIDCHRTYYILRASESRVEVVSKLFLEFFEAVNYRVAAAHIRFFVGEYRHVAERRKAGKFGV
jgi:hypothetical protein